jgi:hypothetical protein
MFHLFHLRLPSLSPSHLEQKLTIGYKDLMKGYQAKVIHLAGEGQKGEVQLVVNLFQSVLDGFIRGEMKKEEEPVKVSILTLSCLGLCLITIAKNNMA